MSEDNNGTIRRIQALYERADHPGTSAEERTACIEKADALMLKYQIDAAVLDATRKPEERRKPVSARWRYADPNADYLYTMQTMMTSLGRAFGVRVANHWDGSATLVGFAQDVEWLQMLGLSVYREFVTRINPGWRDELSIDANVKALKEAAWKWEPIARQMQRRGLWPEGKDLPPKDGGYLIRAYKRECKRLGEPADMRTQNHEGYRYAFIDSFTNRIVHRALEIEAAKAESAQSAGGGAEVALRSASDQVDDAFYELYPQLHPEAQRKRREEAQEYLRKQREKDAAYLASLSPEERKRVLREREREYRKADLASTIIYDNDGARAGRRAADAVDMNRNGNVGGNSKKGLGQ